MSPSTFKRIEASEDLKEQVRAAFSGRLTNQRSAARLDSRSVDEETGEIVSSADLQNLGKAWMIRHSAQQKSGPRCGMKKIVIEDVPALVLTTPCPDGQPSQHVVMLHKDKPWETWGVVARPAGADGKTRVELVPSRYEKWCKGSEPVWNIVNGQKQAANAAAANIWRKSKGMRPKMYNAWSEKHLLAAWEREKQPVYCVPCDKTTGQPFPWVLDEIARGAAIEQWSWDHAFEGMALEETQSVAA